MNTRGFSRASITGWLLVCAAVTLLLSACQPAAVPTSLPPAATQAPTAIAAPTQQPTQAPVVAPTQPPSASSAEFTLDLSGLASNRTLETVAATPAGADVPLTGLMPQYRLLTLQGYPIANHLMKPQIYIYPAGDLAPVNETAGMQALDLQALLKNRQPVDPMPFLPLINAKQVIHPQVKYLDFKSGKGVRFLTWYSQGIVPINNHELIYTYQGLTSDGQYYIAAVLPLNYPGLAASELDVPEPADQFNANFQTYLADMVKTLNEAPTDKFTPDLAKLDAMMASLEVK